MDNGKNYKVGVMYNPRALKVFSIFVAIVTIVSMLVFLLVPFF